MAGNASIVVDIKAQITGYEEQIAKIKQSMKQVDPGSTIGKSLAKNLEQADRKLTELTRKAESRISSQMQLNNLYDQLHQMDGLMRNLGQGMQNVGMNDVLATASDKARELGQQIREAQNQMKTQGSTFFDQLEKGAHSDAFAKVKEQLNFDPKSMGIEQFVSGVEQAIKSAKSNIKDLEQEQESAQNKLDSMRQLQNARNALPANMQMGKPKADAVADYLQIGSLLNKQNEQASRAEVVQSFLTQLQAGLAGDKSHTDEEKGNIGNMISNIAQDLMNAKDQKEIENVLQSLQTALTKGTHFAASKGIGSLTSSSMSEWSQKFQESYAITEEFKTKVGEIQQLVENTPIGQQGLIAQRLNELLQPGDAEQFSDRLTNLITVIQQSMQQLNNEVNRMDINKQQSIVDALGNKITAQKQEVQSLLDISGTKEYQDLLTRVNQFEQDIAQLKQQLNLETDKNARETAANINKAGENVNKQLPTINEKNISDLKQYGSMLENVQARSQMVGKVEGIAQRWFSVYAAVRMVGKAFRTVKENVTNLDKTMTEIAIVTDKSQSDLWGQMPEYTAMARKYGASLQGVYEVSQLYYQQGLEQNDVMALTEQTLKMARISGLDYTEATNYMTNAIRSFKIEMQDSQRVVDVYSALAASSASSTSELATAMSKTASSAAAVGSSFENTSAMMAVMIETTRESPENIGSALKSIISRYGELKENKTGIDEEGEEYSLNKVDTALQSVGISIHDAKGEFRDFDDVITELSGKWDTIDKNTQRYIATVMAGNRQQSRFLALVSNGERLAELSETAANSEDAATLQVLKTMDSIDYKSQQLQTTLQSLYTSTGVETFYKGILDGANQLVKTFTDMPTLFNLPIPAMMSVATNFISMANIVMTALSVLKTKFTSQWNLDDAARKMKRQAENTEEIEQFRNKEQEKTKIQQQEGAKREQAITQEQAAKTKKMNTGSQWALGAQILGTGMNLTAGLISDKGRDNRAAKAGLGIGGSILQYGALGYQLSMGNPFATAAGAALGGLMGLWQNISYIWESTADQAKRMQDEAQEAQTTYKQKNATAKNIEQEIAAVKKLKDAQYDSAEAREKYIEASNKLAEDMPELVSHYDEEGNAIVELSNAYELLTNKRKEANEAATESADASIEAARKATEAAEENIATTGKDRWNKAFDFNKLSEEQQQQMNQALGNLAQEEGYIDTTELNRMRQGTGTLSGLANHVRDHEALQSEGYRYINGFLYNLASNPEALIGDMLGEESQTFLDNYTSEIQQLKDSGQESLATVLEFLVNQTQDALPALKAASGDLAGAKASENAVIRSQAADYVNRYRQAQSDIVNYSTDQSEIAKAKEKLDLFTELTSAGEVATSFIMQKFIDGKYNTWKEFEEATEDGLVDATDQALELLQAIPQGQREAVNDLFKDRDKYTQNQFKERLHKIIGDEDFSTTNAIMDAQTSYYRNILSSDDFVKALNIRNKNEENKFKLTAPEQYQDFSGTELQSILGMYDKINAMYKSGGLTQQNGQAFLNTYNELWNKSSEAEQNILTQITDFSEEGLKNINEAIDNSQDFSSPEQKAAFKDVITRLFGYVPENINTAIENYTSKMATATEDYNKDLSSATKGMDYKAAAEMAKKLGISVTDEYFDSKDGELFLKDTQLLYDHYFGENGITNSLREKVQQSQQNLEKHASYLKSIQSGWDQRSEKRKHISELATGLTVNEIDALFKDFEKSGETDFYAFIKDYYTKQIEGVEGQFKQYQKSAALKQAKESGKAKDLAEAMSKTSRKTVTTLIEAQLKAALQSGDFDYFIKGDGANLITEEAKTILPELMTSQQDAQKSVLNSLIDSTESGLQYIEANIYNTDLLQAMEKAGLAKLNKRGNEVLGATLDNSVENIDQVYEFIEDYGTPLGLPKVRETLAQLHQKQYELTKSSTFTDIMKEYDNIGEVMFEEFAEAWKDTDISSIFKQQADGSYKANLPKLAQFAREHMSELDELAQKQVEETLTKAIDDGMTSITSASDYVTKGTTRYSDMTAFVKQFNEALPGAQATIQDLFGYDKDAQGYVLDPQKYRDYLAGQKQMLQAMGESTEYIDGLIQNANQSIYDAIDIKSFIDAENKQGQAREKLSKQLMNAGIWKQGEPLLSENWQDFYDEQSQNVEQVGQLLTSSGFLTDLLGTVGMTIDPEALKKQAQEQAKANKEVNDKVRKTAAEQMIQTIEDGGIDAVNAMQAIATLQGKELTSADIESAYRAQVSRIESASEVLTSGVGSLVSGEAIQMLEDAGYKLVHMGDGNTAVIQQVGNIADAYAQFYETLKSSGAATLESLNSAYAKVLETRQGRAQEQQAIEALGDASGMTFETLGAIFSEAGINLEQYADELESSGIIKSLGGNKVRIKDFAAFARRMDWETNSEEYLSAFSAFNDNLVEQNAKNKKSVQDELSKLKEAKPGDLLNLTYTMSEMEKWAKSNKKSNQKEIKDAKKRLSKLNESTRIYEKTLDEIQQLQAEDYMTQLSNSLVKMGAVLSDGILQITDEANLLGISRILADAATNLGGTLGAELSDMVQSIIDSYTDVINKGIEGTLTNLEKTDLIKKGKDLGINLTADDFYESAEGFEMTTTAAIKAYTAMGQADTRAKKKIYKTLSQQLKDNNESYATATSMLSHIAELQEDINNLRKQGNDANEERINQLAEEVALAKEMHMYSLTHEDSTWNFMSNDAIPDSIDNALNYFANWGQAKTSLGEWSQKGVSDLNQFAALLQHVQEVADATTGSVEFMGTTVGKNGQITYDKFLDSIDKITKYNEKSGAWEIDNNSMLSVLGLNMNLGSKGITQNTKNAIDAYTQMNTKELEAFYEFGNGLVAVKKSLGNYSDVSFGHTFDDFITDGAFDYKRFMQQLGNTEGALEAFNAFAENVSIDGNNFAELMASSEADFSDGSKNFAAAKSVITMALSEGWDMESDYQAIADQLSSTGFEGELTVGDTTFTVKEGRVITKFEKEGGAEYYDPYGGGPYETATDAWNAINTRELNDFAQLFDKYKNSEQTQSEIAFTVDGMTYTIKVKDDHYVIEQDNGKGVKETSEAETINGAIANSKKQAEKVNQSIAEQMSDAGWQEYITGGGDNYGQGRNFKSGKNLQGFITSDTRSVLQSSSFTSGTQLKQRALELWNDSGLSRKQASAQFKIETGIDIDPNTATESFDKINWDSYIKEADLTQTAADVASGIAAALDNQDVSSRISNSVTSGFTQAMTNMTQEGMEEVKIPIKLDPANAQATIDSIKSEPIPLQYEGVPPEKAPEAPDGEGKINYTIGEKEELPQQVSQGIINWKNNYTIPSGLTTTGTINWKSNGLPKATGTVGLATGDAHAKSTLMGELGPELVVSNNRYFVVGQNGPEFVDLAEDAIVFNHLQTQSLLEKGMSNSRGKAVTNERKAVAYAHGSIHGGPAHDISTWTNKYRPGASNMWDNGTASALSNAVGAAVEEISEAFIKTLDIWYNYLQEIAKLETQLSYEETLRSKLQSDFNKDGQAYYDSQTRSLQQMAKTIAVDQELITKQTEYQQKRYKEMVDAGNPFTAFYELDEDNQLRYKEGAEDRFNAIFSASKLTNAPYETLQEQYNWLINNGFGAYMEYDKEGKKIEVGGENDKNGSGMKSAIQAFVDKMEADREEMQGITDSINDAKSDVLEKQEQQNEILQEMRDNEIDLAEKVMDAIVDKMQRQIDEMTDQKEALQKANDDLIKGLSDTLSKEREMYDMQQSESDLESKRRRLAILQRSGGSASEINSLQAEIDTATKDLYFDKQQQQIDTIQEASDAQIEKMEKQIEIAQESLDWQKKYGLLWDDVYQIMNSQDPNGIAATITEWNSDYWGKNPTELEKDLDDIRFSAGQWKAYSQDVNDIKNYLVAQNQNKENTGEETSGTWKSDETGWWYEHDDGSYTKNDWEKIDGKWYYFNDQGYMHTGWHHQGNDWYYLRDQGDMHTGWHQEGNQWYYFGSDGKMVTGAQTIDGVDYNFGTDGKLGSSNTGSGTKNKKSSSSTNWEGASSINYDINEKPWKKARGGYVGHGIYELGELGTETVFTAAQTKILRDNILSSRPNSLISLLKSYNDNYGHINDAVNKVEPLENNSIVIERAEVNMNVAQLANDYDAQRAGEQALDRMLTIARKTQASNRIGR